MRPIDADALRDEFMSIPQDCGLMYGIKTPDEVRALEEMNPLPNGLGMHPLMTKNLASLEAVIRGDT